MIIVNLMHRMILIKNMGEAMMHTITIIHMMIKMIHKLIKKVSKKGNNLRMTYFYSKKYSYQVSPNHKK